MEKSFETVFRGEEVGSREVYIYRWTADELAILTSLIIFLGICLTLKKFDQ